MNPVTGFLRGYLSAAEMWLFLPLFASVLMAVLIFFVLQHALTSDEKTTGGSDDSEGAFRQRMMDMGKETTSNAKEKAERDGQAIAATKERQRLEKAEAKEQPETSAAADERPTPASSTAPPWSAAAGVAELRRRRGAARASAAAASSADASDNDWELVENEDVHSADDADHQLPSLYQQSTDDFIEAIHESTSSRTRSSTAGHPHACDEAGLLQVVVSFSDVLRSLVSEETAQMLPSSPLPSPAIAAPSASDTPTIRSAILSQLVDTQTLAALQAIADSHPNTELAADSTALLAVLASHLYSS